MAERNLNFDEIVERRGTDCLKYDFAKRRGKPADVLRSGWQTWISKPLPMWRTR